jgi:hypothetical protein
MADFPTLESSYRITADWEIVLPCEVQRRFANDALVLWRPGITAWIRVSENDADTPKEVRLQRLRQASPDEAFDVLTETNGALIRYAYRWKESTGDGRAPALHGFAIGNTGHVQLEVHLDDESDLVVAHKLWRGLRELVDRPTFGCS